MKKGVLKKNQKQRSENMLSSRGIKKSLSYRLLIMCSVILAIFIVGWIILFLTGGKKEEGIIPKGEGELGSVGIYSEIISQGIITYETLDVINYNLLNNDQTISLTLRRRNEAGTLDYISVRFDVNGIIQYSCSYNITSNFPAPEQEQTYSINSGDTLCGNNFTGLYNVTATGVKTIQNINLTQTSNIPEIRLVEGTYSSNVLDLDDYFSSLDSGDSNLGFSYSISNPKVQITIASDFAVSRKLNFNADSNSTGTYMTNITLSYPGFSSVVSNNFIITVTGVNCTDSDGGENYTSKGSAMNLTSNGTDSCHNGTDRVLEGKMVQEFFCNGTKVQNYIINCPQNYYCSDGACLRNTSVNRTPEFIYVNCSINKINWNKNTNFSINLLNCFRDPDNDGMIFSFLNSNTHITIIQSGANLLLVPEKDWYGFGEFVVYANDSISKISATIYFAVNNTPAATNDTPVVIIRNATLRIIDPQPNGTEIADFYGKNLTFAVGNMNYDSIEWYLDGEIVNNRTNFLEISGLSVGNHTLEVKVKKSGQEVSKIWKISIQDNEKGRKWLFNSGWVMFFVILIIIVIIIGLVFWLYFQERGRKDEGDFVNSKTVVNSKIDSGVKVTNTKNPKGNMNTRFNIPR